MNEEHAPLRFHEMPDGRSIAYRYRPGAGPLLVFLPGYMSDMEGGKATAVMDWAAVNGRACLLLDYSGCGRSEGSFAEGTLTRWRDEVLALVETTGHAAVILIGSSMGGWLMLLVAERLGQFAAGLIGIAAAPDFTEWGYEKGEKAALADGATVQQPNPYGPEPTPTYPGFWQDAQRHLCLERGLELTCPVRLLHGQRDIDVPWRTSLDLAEALRSEDVQVHFVKDGDHRLSREHDIALLLRETEALIRDMEG
jgi:pimeloyl-ACP methyl ester carboxylesterase